PLSDRGLEAKTYVLATIHRAENTDNPQRLGAIVDGLAEVASRRPVLWLVHPRTRERLRALGNMPTDVSVGEPVSYLEMIALEAGASAIVTDSGGVQKEAFFHRVPCVTTRDETEWTELVELGWNRLAPPTSGRVVAEA